MCTCVRVYVCFICVCVVGMCVCEYMNTCMFECMYICKHGLYFDCMYEF